MEALKHFNQHLTLTGTVKSINKKGRSFVVETRSGNHFECFVNATSWFDALQNLDLLNRDRVPPQLAGADDPFDTRLFQGELICVEGVWHRHENHERFDCLGIHRVHSNHGYPLFEHTHWWVSQIASLADRWLDDLFGNRRSYALDDFAALYRTNLNILGLPTNDQTQEMATLSRLIYGLSSSFLVTGDQRYYLAARAGVDYQREAFRSISADGRYCFWHYGKKTGKYGVYSVVPSEGHEDDLGTIPLYEQIYALAGLAQYYRITGDWEVLYDIRRTVSSFNRYYRDQSKEGGFFSHLDPVAFSWNSVELGTNRARKNWNSIGDHLPAYLINLILALDPTPQVSRDARFEGFQEELAQLLDTCVDILEVTSSLILTRLPEKGNPYVNERFHRDWTPDHEYSWQRNRAIVGHNLKIAWNLTRVANYYRDKGNQKQAEKLFALASRIGEEMGVLGVDQIRSGLYDAVERQPADPNIPVQFAWSNTKDFWQQEQGILAYLIMYGYEVKGSKQKMKFLQLARELSTFWNMFFLDRERSGVFFRTEANGTPIVRGEYGDKGGHSVSGYHVFELNFLAHLYHRSYLPRKERDDTIYCLHFLPDRESGLRSLNVLPDFLGPDSVEIHSVRIDGVDQKVKNRKHFQIPLDDDDLGKAVEVRLWQTETRHRAQ